MPRKFLLVFVRSFGIHGLPQPKPRAAPVVDAFRDFRPPLAAAGGAGPSGSAAPGPGGLGESN